MAEWRKSHWIGRNEGFSRKQSFAASWPSGGNPAWAGGTRAIPGHGLPDDLALVMSLDLDLSGCWDAP